MQVNKAWMTSRECTAFLKVSLQHFYRLAKQRDIETTQVHPQMKLYRAADVREAAKHLRRNQK